MENFKIAKEYPVSGVREISVDHGGYNYLVIYGKHINGGFFCITNWEVGGDLSSHFNDDVSFNAGRIGRVLENEKAGRAIAEAIASMETY